MKLKKVYFQLNSIRSKLAVLFGLLVLIVSIGLGGISYITFSRAMKDAINQSLSQVAREAAKVVQSRVESQFNALEALAELDSIKSDTVTLEEKLALLQSEAERSGHLRIGIADPSGKTVYTNGSTADLADRAHFQKAMAGERAVSEPIVSKIDGNIILTYAVPIKNGNTVTGVLMAARDGNELSEMINDIYTGEKGSAFMINKSGTIIAHEDKENVLNMVNFIEQAQEDPALQSIADLEQQMLEGKEGTGEYVYEDATYCAGYAPVAETSWSIAVTSPKAEVMNTVFTTYKQMVIMACTFFILGLGLTLLIATKITNPIRSAAEFLNVVATGDLTREVPEKLLRRKDETGILAKAMQTMQESIKQMVEEVAGKSLEMGRVLVSITEVMTQLNQSIEEISATAEEVSAGTEETASSTSEISAHTEQIEKAAEDIAGKAQNSTLTVSNISRMAEEMKENAITSAQNAGEMYDRVKKDLEIALEQSKTVSKINELSESILEITSQTNLLALNAAIEAARAGEAGRGFAVVAEEIRKLAESSSNAVATIKEVTAEVLGAVQQLASSSHEVMEFFDQQVMKDYHSLVKTGEEYSESSVGIKDMISEFSATSEELLASVQNMVSALDQIAKAANEGAEGTSKIAQESANILQISEQVDKLAESAKEKAEHLIDSVSKFKVV